MTSFIQWILSAWGSTRSAHPQGAWPITLKALILIDALIIGSAHALYMANGFGLLSSPIVDLAEPLYDPYPAPFAELPR